LGTIIEHSYINQNIYEEFLAKLIEILNFTLDNSKFSDIEFQKNFQKYILSIITSILITHSINFDKNKIDFLFKTIIDFFRISGEVIPEGIQIINVLILSKLNYKYIYISRY